MHHLDGNAARSLVRAATLGVVAMLAVGPTRGATTSDVAAIASGLNLQPPPPPVFSTLSSPSPGFARATWVPSGDPAVVGYTVSYGRFSVARGQAAQYECTVDAGAAGTHDVSQLAPGTYYFAVRSRDRRGMMSAYSSERSVQIGVDFVPFDEGPALSRTIRRSYARPVSTEP